MSINPKQCRKLKLIAKSWNWMKKFEVECKNLKLNWLTGKSRNRNSQMANQIFCFQIKRTPWMAQFMGQFFPDCVIRMLNHLEIFSYIILIRNHMIFFAQFGLNKPYGFVQFCYSLKNLLVLIYSKLHSKSCDYLYKKSRLFKHTNNQRRFSCFEFWRRIAW